MHSLLWPAINFFVFIALLAWAVKKPFKAMLLDRHEQLKNDIDHTRVQLAEAQKKFQEYSRRIQTLDQEVAQIVQSAREEAESSKVRILTEAKRTADSIVIDAKRSAEGLVAEYKDKVRSDLANQVIVRAEQMVKQKLSQDDRDRLKRDFSRQVETAQ